MTSLKTMWEARKEKEDLKDMHDGDVSSLNMNVPLTIIVSFPRFFFFLLFFTPKHDMSLAAPRRCPTLDQLISRALRIIKA